MKHILLKNKKLLFLGVIAFIVFFFLLFMESKEKGSPPAPSIYPVPTQAHPSFIRQNIKVIRFSPGKTELLQVLKKQTFIIEFDKEVNINNVKLRLTGRDLTTDEVPKPTKINYSTSPDQKTLIISSRQPILSNYEYVLSIVNKTNNGTIFEISYLSEEFIPSPIDKNNLELIPFLPYETTNYRLIYDSKKNLYIFNFKYDDTSDRNLQEQYERAKRDALNYIKGKNIDPSTIKIEWRYS